MIIKCPACSLEIGHTNLYTVDQAVAEHVCLASDHDRETAINWVKFQQIVSKI